MAEKQPLRRTQVREILHRHPGSITRVAEQLKLTIQTVSGWLRGKGTSQRVATACTNEALQLLAAEEKQNQQLKRSA